jgi:hypothetical protein
MSSPEKNDVLVDEDDCDDESSYYGLDLHTSSPVNTGDMAEFIDVFKGRVVLHEWSEVIPAGQFRATVIRTEDAAEEGIPTCELWDETQELCDHYGALFNPRTDDFKKGIVSRFEAYNRDVLILDRIEVFPEHRGKNLGHATALRLIQLLGRHGGLVVCMPHPLQFSPIYEHDPEGRHRLALDTFGRSRAEAFRRLRAYWGMVGFQRLSPREPRFALSPHMRLPKIESLCPKL